MVEYSLKAVMRYRVDMRHCRSLLRDGSRSFHAASLLLPAYYRAPATALYAFCRVADDEIDRGGGHAPALARLHRRLDAIYAGMPEPDPVDRALANAIERFEVPRTLLDALLEGLEWDVGGRRYTTLSELYGYAARVAGTVGVMMAVLMGTREADALARACDLGVAMQLTNIARDVGEDARAGRVYLPLEWLDQHQVDVERWLREPGFEPGVGDAVDQLLAAADRLYDRSLAGIARLPAGCRPGILAARVIYREIGHELRRGGLDSVSRRTVVGPGRKLQLVAAALGGTLRLQRAETAPPLEETRFLVDAAVGV